MIIRFVVWLFTLGTFFALGCETEDASPMRPGSTGGDADQDTDPNRDSNDPTDPKNTGPHSPGFGCDGMDILFVIDDSGSMQEEQDNLSANFPKFISVLDNYKTAGGEGLNYRVGVTTTSVTRNFQENLIFGLKMPRSTSGPNGRLLGQNSDPEPSCDLGDPWLEGPGADVATTFSCMAAVGTSGDPTEMPFAALESALGREGKGMSRKGGPNEGFYRSDKNSLLVVVIITDEDDCSIANGGVMAVSTTGGADCNEKQSKGIYMPEDIKTFLDGLTGGEGRYVLVGIGGPTDCSSDFGSAIKARRLQNLIELTGKFGFFGDICQGDLWYSLEQALEVMTLTCNDMGPVV